MDSVIRSLPAHLTPSSTKDEVITSGVQNPWALPLLPAFLFAAVHPRPLVVKGISFHDHRIFFLLISFGIVWCLSRDVFGAMRTANP